MQNIILNLKIKTGPILKFKNLKIILEFSLIVKFKNLQFKNDRKFT